MNVKRFCLLNGAALVPLLMSATAAAKVFQNTYVALEVPDTWTCIQEGVAWTCTPTNSPQSREAVIVLAAKVAGPEDNMANFYNYLRQPKRIASKVGTPMPSKVLYAQQRMLAGAPWIQAQHLGSEIQDYYTLYLATVREQLAILISFSAEREHYQTYNPIFDKALKSLKIVANQEKLFPKKKSGADAGGAASESIGIQASAPSPLSHEELMPPPEGGSKRPSGLGLTQILLALLFIGGAAWFYVTRTRTRQSKPRPPSPKPRIK